MKKMLFFVLLISQIFGFETHSEITKEGLLRDPEENHIVCFEQIFALVKSRHMLEFGLSFATKYFLDCCKRVLSVEVVTNGYGPNRIRQFIQFYRDYSNWVPIAYFSGYQGDMSWAPYKYLGSNAVYLAASYQCSTHLSYEKIDSFYLDEMGEFISNVIQFNKIDLVFINPVLFLRGDLIALCFHKVPIIVAHCTKCRFDGVVNDVFGYSRIKTPDNYEEIYIPTEQGTTVWVEKKTEHFPLIDALTNIKL